MPEFVVPPTGHDVRSERWNHRTVPSAHVLLVAAPIGWYYKTHGLIRGTWGWRLTKTWALRSGLEYMARVWGYDPAEFDLAD